MATGLGLLEHLPQNLEPPDCLKLGASSIVKDDIGVWSKESIKLDTRFGPYKGDVIISYAHDSPPQNYAWEVLDPETHEFLHYLDPTDLTKSNWMRFVRCAEFFEEQNIVSEQKGTDIYYKVIKEIEPNEELLTWYDMSLFQKSVKIRTKKQRKLIKEVKQMTQNARNKLQAIKKLKNQTKLTRAKMAVVKKKLDLCEDQSCIPNSESSPRKLDSSPGKSDSDPSRSPRSRRKPTILDSYVCGEDSFSENDELKRVDDKSSQITDTLKRKRKNSGINTNDSNGASNNHRRVGRPPKIPRTSNTETSKEKSSLCVDTQKAKDSIRTGVSNQSLTPEPHRNPDEMLLSNDSKISVPENSVDDESIGFKSQPHDSANNGARENCAITHTRGNNALTRKPVLDETVTSDASDVQSKVVSDQTITERMDICDTNVKLEVESFTDKTVALDNCPKIVRDCDDFEFVVQSHHMVQKGGEIVFVCDICDHEEYRHAFSLKRHFLRRHVNYAYISIQDRLNCGLNSKKYLDMQQELPIVRPNEQSEISEKNIDDSGNTVKNLSNGFMDKVELDSIAGEFCTKEVKSNEIKIDGDVEPYRPVVSPISLPDSATGTDDSNTDEHKKTNLNDSVDTEQNLTVKASAVDAFFQEQLAKLNKKIAVLDGLEEPSPEKMPNVSNLCHLDPKFRGVFWCEDCNQLFDDLPTLKEHYKTKHSTMKSVSETHTTMVTDKTVQKASHVCVLCGIKFATKREQEKHQISHEVLTCTKCGKRFKTIGRFHKHQQNIECDAKWSCTLCRTDFANRRNYAEHVRRFHVENICKQCGKITNGLPNHECQCTAPPTNQVPVEIDDRDESMKLANQTHGFRFACTICKKRFREYHFMCRHRRLAHQNPRRRLGNKTSKKSENDTKNDANQEAMYNFYANVAQNIADNLRYHIDGKIGPSQKFSSIKTTSMDKIVPIMDWTKLNFNSAFDPSRVYECTPQTAMDLSSKIPALTKSGLSVCNGSIAMDFVHDKMNQMPHITQWKQHKADAFNVFMDNPRLRFVCTICNERFDKMDLLNEHNKLKHSSISTHFIKVDKESCQPPNQPTSQGILGKLNLPEYIYNSQYQCTKCEVQFRKICDLHEHMVSCGPMLNVKPKKAYLKEFEKPRRTLHEIACGFKVRKSNCIDSRSRKVLSKPERKNSTKIDDSQCIQNEDAQVPRRSNRSTDQVSYDPRRHVRRRDTRTVLDTEQCRACLKRFKNLLVLERHARVCSKKQLFRATPQYSDSGMKCIYCLKHFTYRLSLKKHLIEVCRVKKELLESDQLTGDKLDEEAVILQQIEAQLTSACVKEKAQFSVIRQRKRRRHCLSMMKQGPRRTGEGIRDFLSTEKVNETETKSETYEPKDTVSDSILVIGKRSRKMTVKALESASLQVTLDSLPKNSIGVRALAKKRRRKIPLTAEGRKRRLNNSVINTGIDITSAMSSVPNDLKEVTQNNAEGASIDSSDTVQSSDGVVKTSVSPQNAAPKKPGRKRKIDTAEHVQKLKMRRVSEDSASVDSEITFKTKLGNTGQSDPFDFQTDADDKEPEKTKENMKNVTKTKKKPGPKPKLKPENLETKNNSQNCKTTNSILNSAKQKKSVTSRFKFGVPSVFSKRVANIQRKLRTTC